MRLFYLTFLSILVCSLCNDVSAQNITIKGRVLDKEINTGKFGVTVSAGAPPKPVAITDDNGNFTVNVSVGTELSFSHTGYFPVTHTVVATDSTLEILLEQSSSSSMQEVRVEGYRNKNRDVATGSSAKVSGKAIQDVPVSNVVELLQGKVAGLDVQNNNGSPGGMGTINLRGSSSISVSADGFLTPTSPLFVVDGVPIDVNSGYEYGFQSSGPGISPISLIPPEDIQDIDILRDASATAQYGSRAAYGVIIITTKRGLSKTPIVQYSGQFFTKTPPRLRSVVGGVEERMRRINAILEYDSSLASAMALINTNVALSDSLNPYYNNSTNWQDLFYRTTLNQTHTVQVYGGDRTFNYKTNLSYYSEDGIIQNTGFKRYTLSMNALYQPTEKFRAQINLQGALGQRKAGSGANLTQDELNSAIRSSSLLPASIYSGTGSVFNFGSVRSNNKSANILGSLDLQWQFVPGVTARNNFSYNFNSGTEDVFLPSYINNNNAKGTTQYTRRYVLNNRTGLDYVQMFGEFFQFAAGAFTEISAEGSRANRNELLGFPNDDIEGPIGYNPELSLGGTLANLYDKRLHGYGGYATFNWDTRYIIDFNYRRDATSNNGANAGYTENPAISGRWNFGREKFVIDNVDWIKFGALRGSWGKTISPTGDIFDVYGKYVVGQQYNNNPTVFLDLGTVPNTGFLPQTITKTNFGIELGLFAQNRLEINYDTYYNSNDNEPREIPLPNTSGFQNQVTNEISTANYGHELSLTVRIFRNEKPVQWTVSANGALNRRVVTRLPNGIREFIFQVPDGGVDVPVVYRIGRDLSPLLYYNQGVYASTADVPVNPATGLRQQLGNQSFYFQGGDPKWVDVNGDYVIDDQDLLPLGNPFPRATGGIISNVQWNGFTLITQVNYTLIRDVLNAAAANDLANFSTNIYGGSSLPPIEQYNYWKPDAVGSNSGTVGATYPNPFDFRRAEVLKPFRNNQSLFLEDGSYWKLGQVTLSYNLDRNFIKRFGMTSARLAFTAANVYTFSKYSGPDPELVTALGRDNSNGYPNARTYSMSINVQF
ncbi:SusC/RagA family TonB-linked outer membrane protein [Niabella insulamsoli]|uniref:SusC/RagA family TonB-linked outer membrane protein n=1 Tax=Niabella insulamsoli TaxID=3144874 RepID=UPI0031FC4049